ncbi:MAG: pyridoxal-phosphate dependent enzyme [Pseudomonadota bacterium]
MSETAIDTRLDPDRPLALLAHCPVHAPTPMAQHRLDGRRLWIKDETARMGLGAFTALGGVYAVAALLRQGAAAGVPAGEMAGEAARDRASGTVFVCASAGNHGMAVAAGARLFGAGCRIHLAETVPEAFARRLAAKGAEVVRSGATYEASIAAAIADAAATGAVHLADGSWPGYTAPPRLVMEGYTVMAEEMRATFEAGGRWPVRVYLQAGVGGLAAAIAQRIRAAWTVQPEIVVVEPEAAPCLAESVRQGRMVAVEGPVSVMGRLDCKEPSLIAFEILREAADRFVTVTDGEAGAVAARAAHDLGMPTTPSGAAGLAAWAREGGDDALVILSEGALD